MTSVAIIEDAIVAKVIAASDADALGYKFKTVKSYGGELDMKLAELARTKFPACLVVFKDESEPIQRGIGEVYRVTFTMICGTKSYRNEKETRHGIAGEVGGLQVVKDVRALLKDQDLGLEITEIKIGATKTLANGKFAGQFAAVYSFDVTTEYLAEQPVDPSTLNDFKHFHVDWDLPPTGDVDFEDDIILETQNA